MNDDYLWDKSGPPDPEIKQLEEILGTLRYQPKPFEVPAPRRRSYFPLLAIAATLLIALVAGGIWLRVRTRDEVPPQQAAVPEKTPIIAPAVDEKTAPTPKPQNRLAPREQNVVVYHKRRNTPPALTQHDREEALAVKQQLMFALRLASEKLNLAHRKTQGMSPANQIKNQHRVG